MKVYNELIQWIKFKNYSCEEMNEDGEDTLEYKILVLGDPMVGKSSFCSRFVMNDFSLEMKANNSTVCYSKKVKIFEQSVKVYLVDVENNMLQNYKPFLYPNVKAGIILYDITKSKTFENVDQWLKEAKNYLGNTIPFMMVGNKTDLQFLKNVDKEQADEKAALHHLENVEVNCIDASSVKEAMKHLIAKIYFMDLSDSQKEQYKKMPISKNDVNHNTITNTNANDMNTNNK